MDYDFPYIGNVIIPTDFHSIIFQRGGSSTNQYQHPCYYGVPGKYPLVMTNIAIENGNL